MPSFYCNNPECELFEQDQFLYKVSYAITPNGTEPKIDNCSRCGCKRASRPVEGAGIPHFQKWNLKSSDEKKSILKKESSEHFQKHIKPKIMEMNKKGLNTMGD